MTRRSRDECQYVLQLLSLNRNEEAFRKCERLAEAGSVEAEVLLGWIYETGKGVEQDLKMAEGWYRKAAAGGSAVAEFYLAGLYRARRDFQRAREWFEKSAEHGFGPALYHLGRMYRLGIEGVVRDEMRGFDYIDRAAATGHLFARRDRAYRMIGGSCGIQRIPLGILKLLAVLSSAMLLESKAPNNDRLLRL